MESKKFKDYRIHFNSVKNFDKDFIFDDFLGIEVIKTCLVSGVKFISCLIHGQSIKHHIFHKDMGYYEAQLSTILHILPHVLENYENCNVRFYGVDEIVSDWFFQAFWSANVPIWSEHLISALDFLNRTIDRGLLLDFSPAGYDHKNRKFKDDFHNISKDYDRIKQSGIMTHFQYMQSQGLKAKWVVGTRSEDELNSQLLYQGMFNSRIVDKIKMIDVMALIDSERKVYDNSYWLNNIPKTNGADKSPHVWQQLKDLGCDFSKDIPFILWLYLSNNYDHFYNFIVEEYTNPFNRNLWRIS